MARRGGARRARAAAAATAAARSAHSRAASAGALSEPLTSQQTSRLMMSRCSTRDSNLLCTSHHNLSRSHAQRYRQYYETFRPKDTVDPRQLYAQVRKELGKYGCLFSLSLSLSLALARSLARARALSLSLPPSPSLSLSRARTQTHTLSLSHPLYLIHTLTPTFIHLQPRRRSWESSSEEGNEQNNKVKHACKTASPYLYVRGTA